MLGQRCRPLLSQSQQQSRSFVSATILCARRKPQTHPTLPVPNAHKRPSTTSDAHPLWQFFHVPQASKQKLGAEATLPSDGGSLEVPTANDENIRSGELSC